MTPARIWKVLLVLESMSILAQVGLSRNVHYTELKSSLVVARLLA
jgi:hypothetical protein